MCWMHHQNTTATSKWGSAGSEHTQSSKTFTTWTINSFRGCPQATVSTPSRPGRRGREEASSLRPRALPTIKNPAGHSHSYITLCICLDYYYWSYWSPHCTCSHWSLCYFCLFSPDTSLFVDNVSSMMCCVLWFLYSQPRWSCCNLFFIYTACVWKINILNLEN